MAKLSIAKGATSVLVRIFVMDSTSTVGAGKTGLTAASFTGTKAYVARDDDGNAAGTALTLTDATRGTWSSGGIKEKDATNMPGVYELGLSNASLASGARSCTYFLAGTGIAPLLLEIELTGVDNQDAVRGGMTSLPNVAAGASGGVPLSVDASGRVDVLKVNGTSQTAGDIIAKIGTPAGASIAADVAAVKVDTAATRSAVGTAGSGLTALGDTRIAHLDADVSSRLATSGYTVPPTAAANATATRTELSTELARIDVATSTRLASASYTAPDNAGIATAAAAAASAASSSSSAASTASTIDGKIGTPATTIAGDIAAVPTDTENADALLDRADAIEFGLTPRGAMRLQSAAAAGKLSGAATTTATVRNVGDTKDRIVATVDANGNRTAITTDVS